MVAPSAQGTLAETPLSHLLVYALDHRLEGTLVIEEPAQRRHAIYFSGGAPTIVHSAEPTTRLGEVLVRQGALTASALEPALVRARAARKLLGAALVEAGLVDRTTLERALVEQMAQTLLFLHARPSDSAFGYYDRINYLERLEPTALQTNPLPLIWRLFREAADERRAAEAVKRLGEGALRLHVAAPIAQFGFDPRVQAVVDVLRAKPQPFAELAARALVPEPMLKRLFYMFCLLRHLDLPGTAPPVGALTTTFSSAPPVGPSPTPVPQRSPSPVPGRSLSPAPSPSPTPHPSGRTPTPSSPDRASTPDASGPRPKLASFADIEALRADLQRRADNPNASYYDTLGVPRDASPATIQSAFFQLAKTLHPDRLPPELADLKDVASRVFARLSEAHQVLADARRRREYDERLERGAAAGEDQEQVQRVLRAATAYQKALVLFRRNQLDAAEQEAKFATENDPEQADYLALLAWIQAHKPNPDLGVLLVRLDKAVDMEPNNIRARWYRGQILKWLGKDARAVQDFRAIVERDPKHVDAQREVMLYEKRRTTGKSKSDPPRRSSNPPVTPSSDKPKSPVTSVLGRLFKKR